MLKQLLRLTSLLWVLLLLVLFGAHWLGELRQIPLIAFLSDRERHIDIYLADSESGLTIGMTDNLVYEDRLSWSPDGRYLFFDLNSTPDTTIWLLDTSDWTIEELDLGEYSYARWHSPNELRIHINRTGEEYLFNVETHEREAYIAPLPCETCPRERAGGITFYDLGLSIVNDELNVVIDTNAYTSTGFEFDMGLQFWSPDGQSFFFITNLQGQIDIYLSAAEGGVARRLTNTITSEPNPLWSPDGQHISYVSYEDGNPEIYISDLATGYRYNLSRHEGRELEPVWQPIP